MAATIGVVRAYMATVRRAAEEGKFAYDDRQKNRATRLKLGFTTKVVKDEILSLTEADYVDGPEPDDDPTRPRGG